jgi:branched-chain amino acid transport system ATP-binding protein
MTTQNIPSDGASPVADAWLEPVLEVSGLQAGYGAKKVIYGIDFVVGKGEVVGIIGHNGAGKTTTLHTVFGTHRAESGTVRYKGTNITGRSAKRNVRDGMTMVRAERFIFAELTVKENLLMAAMSVKSSSAQREERLAKIYHLLPILKERSRQQAGKFSGGQQRLLSIGMSMLADPALIILDEPSLGIAPTLTERIFDTVKGLVRDSGISVLIVEQNIPQLLRIVDRVYVIRSGRVLLQESVEQMRARETYWDLF